MNSKTIKAIVIVVVLLLSSAVLGVTYFYLNSLQEKVQTKENEIENLRKIELSLKEDFSKMEERQKAVIDKNRALQEEVKVFEEQKGTILNQVRTSVAGFENFRQSATAEIARLQASVDSLESEKMMSEEKLKELESLSKAEREDLTKKVDDLTQEIGKLKTTETQLSDNLEQKDKVKIVSETGKLHYNLGNFYFKNNAYIKAAEEYKKAIFYNPDDADANFNLAVVSDDFLGDRKTAIFRYKRYLELNPKAKDYDEIQRRLLDLEIRDKVMDEPAPKTKQTVFKEKDSQELSKFNFRGDKR